MSLKNAESVRLAETGSSSVLGTLIPSGGHGTGFSLVAENRHHAWIQWGTAASAIAVTPDEAMMFELPEGVKPWDVLRLPVAAITEALEEAAGTEATIIGEGLLRDVVQAVLQRRGVRIVSDARADLLVSLNPEPRAWAPLAAEMAHESTLVLFVPPGSPPQDIDMYHAVHRPSHYLRAARWHRVPKRAKTGAAGEETLKGIDLEDLWRRWVRPRPLTDVVGTDHSWSWVQW